MFRQVSLFLIPIFVAGAMAQIAAPHLGYIVDRSGGLRPVTGVAGAFIVGQPMDAELITAAFSGKTLVVKKAAELLVNGTSFPAPHGAAEAKFTSTGDLDRVFFPDASMLWTWRSGKFDESHASDPAWRVLATQDDEVSISGAPVRLPSRVRRVSQLGENWSVVYSESGIYAVRDGKVFELPEGDQE